MHALTASSACITASGAPIEYTSARRATAAAHTNLPPSNRHAKLARGGRARACASHSMMRPWRAQLLECVQAVRSRAAFKRTLDSVRKRMLGCTRDADLAGGCLGRSLKPRPKHNPYGPTVALVYRTRNICVARVFGRRFCPIGGIPEHAI